VNIIRFFLVLSLLCLRAMSASALPIPMLEVSKLIDGANTIVIGKIARVRGSRAYDSSQEIEVVVERVVRADAISVGSALRITLPVSGPMESHISVGGYGLFFAKCPVTGNCAPVSVTYPSLLTIPGAASPQVESKGVVAQVIDELIRVLVVDDSVLISSASPGQQAMRLREDTIEAFTTIPRDFAVPALLAAIGQSSSVTKNMAVTAALVQLGEYSTLAQVESEMLQDNDENQSLRLSIAYSVYSNSTRPQSLIAPMTRWLKAKEVVVRRAAADVLRDIHSAETIRPLATLALYDSDRDVRYFAVFGLAEATGRGDAMSLELFKASETRYVDDWRKWAVKTGLLK
jgi:HEAT repeats